MRYGILLLIAMLYASTANAGANDNYVITLSVNDVAGQSVVGGTMITTGGPVEWTYGTTNAYPYISCTSTGKTQTKTLASDTLFGGVKVFASVQDGRLLLNTERHLISPLGEELLAEFKTGKCDTRRARASVHKASDQRPAKAGEKGEIALGDNLTLVYRINVLAY